MAVWKLQHREPYAQRPYLYFVAFCDQQVVDKLEESHIIHPGLEIAALSASHFRSGSDWTAWQQEHHAAAEQAQAAPLAVALHGQVAQHESLDYLRDSLEVMTSLIGHGAVAVYDAVTQTWYDSTAWERMVDQGTLLNPFDHVRVIDNPDEDETSWLRTQGLRKFGRPDVSVRTVKAAHRDGAHKMLDRFVNHLALGGLPEQGREVTMEGLGTYRFGTVEGGPDNSTFHNHFVELEKV